MLPCVGSTDEIKGFLHFCYNVFISSISFFIFLRVSISLLPLVICFYMLSFFSIRDGNMVIDVILNFLSAMFDDCCSYRCQRL